MAPLDIGDPDKGFDADQDAKRRQAEYEAPIVAAWKRDTEALLRTYGRQAVAASSASAVPLEELRWDKEGGGTKTRSGWMLRRDVSRIGQLFLAADGTFRYRVFTGSVHIYVALVTMIRTSFSDDGIFVKDGSDVLLYRDNNKYFEGPASDSPQDEALSRAINETLADWVRKSRSQART